MLSRFSFTVCTGVRKRINFESTVHSLKQNLCALETAYHQYVQLSTLKPHCLASTRKFSFIPNTHSYFSLLFTCIKINIFIHSFGWFNEKLILTLNLPLSLSFSSPLRFNIEVILPFHQVQLRQMYFHKVYY